MAFEESKSLTKEIVREIGPNSLYSVCVLGQFDSLDMVCLRLDGMGGPYGFADMAMLPIWWFRAMDRERLTGLIRRELDKSANRIWIEAFCRGVELEPMLPGHAIEHRVFLDGWVKLNGLILDNLPELRTGS